MDASSPTIAFINDFPPFPSSAGALLIERLFAGLPSESIHVVYSSACRYRLTDSNPHHYEFTVLPELNPTGRWGWGRLKHLLNYLLVPINAVRAAATVRKKRSDVIVTVAHDRLCLAACLVSMTLKKPLVIIVHDDWAFLSYRSSPLPFYRLYQWLFRAMLGCADRTYAVSQGMAARIREQYGLSSVWHYPAVDIDRSVDRDETEIPVPRFVYLGNYGSDNSDCLDLLAEALKRLPPAGGRTQDWRFDLYTGIGESERDAVLARWADDRIHFHPWVAQSQLYATLKKADILVLPHSFRPSQVDFVSQSFPTKTADYLNSGKLILVIAPPYSALNRYAKEWDFGELVETFEAGAVAEGISRLLGAADYRRKKRQNALKALEANHDIAAQRREFTDCLTTLSLRRR